jgi:pimeloyl-ACP methyl ester carboxylesterase
MRRGYVDTPEGQMHYREDGDGPPTVVLIHQALRSSLEYRRVVPHLRDRARVISVDLMGYGDSDPPPQPYDVAAHAARVAELLQVLDVERLCLVGHHTGGNVAMEVAAGHPELVERLVLSGPAFVIDEAEREQLVSKMSAIEYPTPSSDGSHLLGIWREGLSSSFDVPRLPASEPELLADFFLEQIKVGPRRKEAHIAAFSHLAAPTLAEVSAPILIIVGDEDMWVCRRWEEMLQVQPSARLERLATAGEAPRLLPERFAQLILSHLDADGG